MDKEKKINKKLQEEQNGYYSKRPQVGANGPSKIWQELSKGMTYFVVIAAGIAFYFALLRLPNISDGVGKAIGVLKPILYGLLFAFIFNPFVKAIDGQLVPILQKRLKDKEKATSMSRTIGIFSSIILLIVFVAVLFNLLIPELYLNIRNLVFTLPRQIDEWMDYFGQLSRNNSNMGNIVNTLLNEANKYIQNWLSTNLLQKANDFMGIIATGAVGFVSEIFKAVIGLIVSIYVLYSKEVFGQQGKKLTYALFNPHNANFILHVVQKANEIFGGFFVGKIIDSAIIGIICFVGLSILNMPYILLVSVIVGVTNIIPFFGPYIGAVPSFLLIVLTDPIKGVYFAIFVFLLQQLDGNFIGPKILGNSTGLSSFWVIFAILLGGGLFGILGMLLGVPTFAVIYYVAQLLINGKLAKKNLPEESEYYDEYSFVDNQGKYIISDDNIRKQNQKKEKEDANSSKE